MEPIILAGAASVVMAAVVLFGITRVFRQRKITMVDYPELPPPDDKKGSGPTMQA
ncbi:MAG: hypothetical protein Q8R02_01980 [Hyphomonadaceae bacterium]|nr:hypothetical protein [Hyphomonadaceae bacterium]